MIRIIHLGLVLLTLGTPAWAQFTAVAGGTATPGLPVSDTNPVATSTIFISETLSIADIQVGIDVTHTWRGDLEVEVTSPAGTTLRLHDHQGGSGADLILTWWQFGVANGDEEYDCACEMQPAPGSFFDWFGQSAYGTWTMTVTDTVLDDDGTFNSWSVAISDMGPPLPIEAITCNPELGTGVVNLNWGNPPSGYDEILVRVNGTVIDTIAGISTTYSTPGLSLSTISDICLSGVLDGLESLPTCCSTFLPGPPSLSALIFAGEGPGDIDSAAALEAALSAQGISVDVVTGLTPSIVDTPASLWLCLGTFPNAHVMTQAEGGLVRDLVVAGIPLYVEGADTWGFHPATPMWQVDGVADFEAEDGDDSLAVLVGADFAGQSFADLTAEYDHDQPGSDWTDRLVPAINDIAGPESGVIWRSEAAPGGAGYDVGVLYDTVAPFGRVIAQSWEFGGYSGDQAEVAARYVEFLGQAKQPSGVHFLRGDSNGDGSFNIADAVSTLALLFTLGAPVVTCLDAADANDDGQVDIGDPIFTLSALFISGAPLPYAPGPTGCGLDTTADAIDCAFFLGCF